MLIYLFLEALGLSFMFLCHAMSCSRLHPIRVNLCLIYWDPQLEVKNKKYQRKHIQNNSNQKFNHNLPLYLYKEGLKYFTTPRAREPNRKRNSHGIVFIPWFFDMHLNLKSQNRNYDAREKYSKKYERKASAQ